jgi:histidine triad (HIT) family protein
MNECIFCKIIVQALPSELIWQDDEFYAFLDIRPVNPGRTLIIPKQQVDYVFDLDDAAYNKLFQIAKMLARSIQTALAAKRIGIAVEGFSVPHVHVHLVPIHGLGELDPNRATKATPDQLVEIAAKIKAKLAEE